MSNRTDQWFESWRDLLSHQPWQSTLEDWWRQFSRQGDSSSLPVFEKIAAQSHSFFQLGEELAKLDPGNSTGTDWQANLDRMFNELKQALDAPSSNQARNLFWQMPLANWQSMVSSMPGFSSDQLAAVGGQPAFDPQAKWEQRLSTPGLGYTRESQAGIQKLNRLMLDYLKTQQRYNNFFVEMSKESLDSMRERLTARVEDGAEPLKTVREFYDLWVDCSEAVYQARTMTDEYARLHGDRVNALMALKQQAAMMMDDWVDMMNMPTRREMDTINLRSQAARRTSKELEQRVEMLKRREADLTRQVTELCGRIESLSLGRSQTAVKKAPGRKKTSPKKAIRKQGAGETEKNPR